MRPLMGIARNDGKQKPAIIKFYDFTKDGTDILDQKISKYLCKSVTRSWAMVHFFFLLDTIRCNALTMYAIKHGKPLSKISAFDIGWDIVMNLVKPFIEIRPTVGLGIGLCSKISVGRGRNVDESVEAEAYEYHQFGETKQWHIFLFHISGQNQKGKKDPMKKLKSRCQKCGKPVCDNHSNLVCEKHLSFYNFFIYRSVFLQVNFYRQTVPCRCQRFSSDSVDIVYFLSMFLIIVINN